MNQVVLLIIRFYQKIISPALPGACRYYPSCSEYSKQAFTHFGFFKALWLSVKRISKCNPLFEGYFDPLIKTQNKATDDDSSRPILNSEGLNPSNIKKGINHGRQTK